MEDGGKKTVCVQIPYRLYRELKDRRIVMSEVMREALEKSVDWKDEE
jgi:hypothetical protein